MIPAPEYDKAIEGLGNEWRRESGLFTESWFSPVACRNALSETAETNAQIPGYSSLCIQAAMYGTHAADRYCAKSGDIACSDANLETTLGARRSITCRYPLQAGGGNAGPEFTAHWSALAAGCALGGVPLTIGEDRAGMDPESEFKNGRLLKASGLERQMEAYLRYFDGQGALLVQLGVEDFRCGVAEYLADAFAEKIGVELTWGNTPRSYGQVLDMDEALFLHSRGYLLEPDPSLPTVREACRKGSIRRFVHYSRLGYTALPNAEQVEKHFRNQVTTLRKLGFRSIALKVGACGMEALALALKLAGDCKLDLLSVDASAGCMPPLLLHAKTYEYAALMAANGQRVPDISLGGGLDRPGHIFKALALAAPYVKLVCAGSDLMQPVRLGKNIEGVLHPERRRALCGQWDALPPHIAAAGNSVDTIFPGYHALATRLGNQEILSVPFGAIALYTYLEHIGAQLQHDMTLTRKFSVSAIARSDIGSMTDSAQRHTGIPLITSMQDEAARRILLG